MAVTHKLIYVTGNPFKLAVAERALAGSGIVLVQRDLDAPEIQSDRVEDVAIYAGEWACRRLGEPVVVTDGGFYIEALNGFPGPFVKFVNQWLTAQDLLDLVQGKDDRRIVARDCLAYCRPGKEPVTFRGSYPGRMPAAPGGEEGWPMDRVFIPDGYTVPASDLSAEERLTYWSRADVWVHLRRFLGV